MELSKLAAAPELVEVTIDEKAIINKYSNGEPITFWTWDRLPLDAFMKLTASDDNGTAEMFDTVRPLILDKDGKEILVDEKTLPTAVLAQAIKKIVGGLGK